jgi:hypothetical protein
MATPRENCRKEILSSHERNTEGIGDLLDEVQWKDLFSLAQSGSRRGDACLSHLFERDAALRLTALCHKTGSTSFLHLVINIVNFS